MTFESCTILNQWAQRLGGVLARSSRQQYKLTQRRYYRPDVGPTFFYPNLHCFLWLVRMWRGLTIPATHTTELAAHHRAAGLCAARWGAVRLCAIRLGCVEGHPCTTCIPHSTWKEQNTVYRETAMARIAFWSLRNLNRTWRITDDRARENMSNRFEGQIFIIIYVLLYFRSRI